MKNYRVTEQVYNKRGYLLKEYTYDLETEEQARKFIDNARLNLRMHGNPPRFEGIDCNFNYRIDMITTETIYEDNPNAKLEIEI